MNVAGGSFWTRIINIRWGYSISAGRLPLDVHNLAMDRFKHEATLMGSIGNIILMPADVGGTFLFLHDLGIINLGKIAESMGSFAVLAPIAAIPLLTVVSVLYAVGYALIAINATVVLLSSKYNTVQKRQALIELIAAVLQVVVAVLIIVGYINPVLCPILATVACLMGGVAFLHRWKYPESAPDYVPPLLRTA